MLPQITLSSIYVFRSTSHLSSGGSLLLWQRSESKIRLDDAELREEGLGLVIFDAWVNDDIITGDPVDWGGDAMLVAGLERIDYAEDFSGVAAGGGGVGEDETDGLLGIDDEN